MTNHYCNLLAQVDKLHRHNRQGSYKTRARYYRSHAALHPFHGGGFPPGAPGEYRSKA